MSESHDPLEVAHASQAVEGEAEAIDALPVPASRPPIVRVAPFSGGLPEERRSAGAVMPAVQAAAVAAGGFMAGAAVVGLVHRRKHRAVSTVKGRRGGRGVANGGRGSGRVGELVQIVGSRSLLVDVHLLGGSGER